MATRRRNLFLAGEGRGPVGRRRASGRRPTVLRTREEQAVLDGTAKYHSRQLSRQEENLALEQARHLGFLAEPVEAPPYWSASPDEEDV